MQLKSPFLIKVKQIGARDNFYIDVFITDLNMAHICNLLLVASQIQLAFEFCPEQCRSVYLPKEAKNAYMLHFLQKEVPTKS